MPQIFIKIRTLFIQRKFQCFPKILHFWPKITMLYFRNKTCEWKLLWFCSKLVSVWPISYPTISQIFIIIRTLFIQKKFQSSPKTLYFWLKNHTVSFQQQTLWMKNALILLKIGVSWANIMPNHASNFHNNQNTFHSEKISKLS